MTHKIDRYSRYVNTDSLVLFDNVMLQTSKGLVRFLAQFLSDIYKAYQIVLGYLLTL